MKRTSKRAFYMLMCTLSTVNRSPPRASSKSKIAGDGEKEKKKLMRCLKRKYEINNANQNQVNREIVYSAKRAFFVTKEYLHSSRREMIFFQHRFLNFVFCQRRESLPYGTRFSTVYERQKRKKLNVNSLCAKKCRMRTSNSFRNFKFVNTEHSPPSNKFSMSAKN